VPGRPTPTKQALPARRVRGARPHVVIEDAELPAARLSARSLRRAGFDVTLCGGPELLSRRRCPLEEGTTCPAIADADVVVASLGQDTLRQTTVVAELRRRYPGTPLVVLAAPPVAHRHRHDLDGCRVVPHHHRGALAGLVEELIERAWDHSAP
jgi:hypothetical protein